MLNSAQRKQVFSAANKAVEMVKSGVAESYGLAIHLVAKELVTNVENLAKFKAAIKAELDYRYQVVVKSRQKNDETLGF
jgi:hypothetical protein